MEETENMKHFTGRELPDNALKASMADGTPYVLPPWRVNDIILLAIETLGRRHLRPISASCYRGTVPHDCLQRKPKLHWVHADCFPWVRSYQTAPHSAEHKRRGRSNLLCPCHDYVPAPWTAVPCGKDCCKCRRKTIPCTDYQECNKTKGGGMKSIYA